MRNLGLNFGELFVHIVRQYVLGVRPDIWSVVQWCGGRTALPVKEGVVGTQHNCHHMDVYHRKCHFCQPVLVVQSIHTAITTHILRLPDPRMDRMDLLGF